MPMHPATAPADGLRILQEGLARITGGPGAGGAAPFALESVPLTQTMHPIPVYTASLPLLVAGQGLAAAVLIGWQYLLLDESRVVRCADIYPQGSTGQHRFGSLTNAFAEGMEQAIAVAETLDPVKDPQASYELRLLRIPPLFVTSLWLKDLRAAADLFVVVPPAPEPFRPLLDYSEAIFAKMLQDAARRRTATGTASGPRSGGALSMTPGVPQGPATS